MSRLFSISKQRKEEKSLIYPKIVKYCEENSISISAFEKKCDIGNGTIARWEKESKPSLDSLEKIASVTGIPLAEWLKESEG